MSLRDYHKVPSWSITEFTEDFQVFGLGVFCSQHQRCVMNEYLRYRPGRDLPRWDSLGPYPFTDKFDMAPLPLPFLISIVIFAYGGPLVLRFNLSGPPFQRFSFSRAPHLLTYLTTTVLVSLDSTADSSAAAFSRIRNATSSVRTA